MQTLEQSKISNFAESLSISKNLAEILIRRGFLDYLESKKFLYPNIFNLFEIRNE